MGQLSAYLFMTLNGFFTGPGDDISWHTHGDEEARFSVESLARDDVLLFGRKTYDLMAAFWPTPMAVEQFPDVAAGMNRADKVVFTRSSFAPAWEGTRCITGELADEVRKLKETAGKDLTILGSGSIVSQLTEHRLIDEYQVMIDPVAIGEGTPILAGITGKVDLNRTDVRTFDSGVVLLTLTPAAGR